MIPVPQAPRNAGPSETAVSREVTQFENREAARLEGFVPLTTGYRKGEEWMLKNALRSLAWGNIPAAIVETREGREIWRSRLGYRTAKNMEGKK